MSLRRSLFKHTKPRKDPFDDGGRTQKQTLKKKKFGLLRDARTRESPATVLFVQPIRLSLEKPVRTEAAGWERFAGCSLVISELTEAGGD